MGNVKKSVAKRTRHQRQYDRRVNKRQMQTHESKVDMGNTLDVGLVVTESSGKEFGKQDTSSRSGNDTDANDADIRPVYDEEPMAEVQMIAECNVFDTGQQHTEQPEFNNKGRVDQDAEQNQVKTPLLDPSLDIKTTEFSNQSLDVAKLLTENEHLNKEKEHLKQTYKDLYDSIKKTRVQTKDHNDSLIAQLNKKSIKNADLKSQILEKVFAIAALKNELRKLQGNSVDTKFANPSILGKPLL
ncbi:hypothetical protein Tco_0419321 [Tanacetum coccineum]